MLLIISFKFFNYVLIQNNLQSNKQACFKTYSGKELINFEKNSEKIID